MSPIQPEQLRRLVRETLEAVLRERTAAGLPDQGLLFSPPGTVPQPDATPSTPGILVLLNGGQGDLDVLQLALRTLAAHSFLHLLPTPDFLDRYGHWFPELPPNRFRIHSGIDRAAALALLPGARGLVIPLLSRSLAAKASLAIDDDFASSLLMATLETGLPVVAVRSDADPATLKAVPSMIQGPNSLRHLLETCTQRLTAWGVQWSCLDLLAATVFSVLQSRGQLVSSGESTTPSSNAPGLASLRSSVAPSKGTSSPSRPRKRQFITREDLWGLLERGESQLVVGPLDIVTPEAEDFAVSRGIRILRQD